MNRWNKKPERRSAEVRLLREKSLKSGETLVEVMVSVVIFLLLVALLQGSVSFCTSAQHKSREIRENTQTAIANYWLGYTTKPTEEPEQVTLHFQKMTIENESVDIEVKLDEAYVSDGDGGSVTFYTFGNGASTSGGTGDGDATPDGTGDGDMTSDGTVE